MPVMKGSCCRRAARLISCRALPAASILDPGSPARGTATAALVHRCARPRRRLERPARACSSARRPGPAPLRPSRVPLLNSGPAACPGSLFLTRDPQPRPESPLPPRSSSDRGLAGPCALGRAAPPPTRVGRAEGRAEGWPSHFCYYLFTPLVIRRLPCEVWWAGSRAQELSPSTLRVMLFAPVSFSGISVFQGLPWDMEFSVF